MILVLDLFFSKIHAPEIPIIDLPKEKYMSIAELPKMKKHTRLEDVQAVILGTLIIALGVNLFTHAGLLTGGSAGLAFLMKYSTPLTFGQAFFLINLPFYILAILHFGWEFTIKTFL